MPRTENFHVTTVKAPLELWAALDEVRAARARRTGRRPLTCELLLEALAAFIEKERKR